MICGNGFYQCSGTRILVKVARVVTMLIDRSRILTMRVEKEIICELLPSEFL